MTLLDRIERTGRRHGGVVVLDRAEALAIVREASAADLPLLGVDAFVIRPDGVQPLLEWSLDTSAMEPQAGASAIRALLDRVERDDLVFEITL